MQSAFHNLPTVGGVMQHSGVEYSASERKYSSNDERATVSFNIADAYPREAGVKSWIRTVTLDRKSDRITVEEDFELERAVPVSLSVMTPRVPSADASGRVTMKLTAGQGNPALLTFDGATLTAKVEKIVLTDPHLREDWGDQIYRILLNSNQSVAKGKFSYAFTRA
jgi:hypothetical protein